VALPSSTTRAQDPSAPFNSSTLTGRGITLCPGRPGREGIGPRRRRATLQRDLPGIERRGLLGGKRRGRWPVVWRHLPAKSFGATLHAIQRHGRRAEAVLILLVAVSQAWPRKNHTGLWYSVRDISADRIRRVLSFAELAGASAA
jgi:hypothetical protein